MKRLDKTLGCLILLSGAFALTCYGSYLIKLIMFPEGTLPLLSVGIVFCAVILPVSLNRQLRRLLGKAYLPLKSVYCAGLCFYMVSFLLMCAVIYLPAANETPPESLPENTVIVTFGAKVGENGEPGKPLARRLEKTAELMRACPTALCVVTGGQGDDEPCSEADAMKNRLVELGIEAERIITEDRAGNTLENIEFTAELMEELGLTHRPVACVSTDFHIPRIRYLAEKYDFGDFYYGCNGSTPFNDFGSLVREYMSYGKLFLLGHL